MTVDLIVIFVLALAAFLGWRSGAISQIGRIAAAILAVLGAPYLAVPVREVVFADSELSQPLVEAGSLFTAGVLIYLGVALTGWLIVRAMRATSDQLTLLDKMGGGLIGTLKGLLVAYFLLTVFVLLQVPVETLDPSNAMALRGGHSTQFVEEHNVLAPWQLPRLDMLHTALKVRYYADELNRERVLHDHARATDFLRTDAVSTLAEDRALMQAVLEDRYAFTLADPRVRALLADETFTQKLASIDWQSLLAEVQSTVHS